MNTLDRRERGHIIRQAREVRLKGQLADWSTARIAAVIIRDIPQVSALEARRLAVGWSRPEVIAGIATLYRRAQLGEPAVNSSMLCRWEHGDTAPSAEYADALARVYEATPEELGLSTRSVFRVPSAPGPDGGNQRGGRTSAGRWAGLDPWASARAVRESVHLAWQADGPDGGQMTLQRLEEASRYYDLNYGRFPPALLASEVQECRAAVTGMLAARQPGTARTELLRLAARFSALLGNLAFHVDECSAAEIHLNTAAQLADTAGCNWLHAWALGASSTLALSQGQPGPALDLASQALQAAEGPLRRAQAISWALLPAYVRLGRHDHARDAMAQARRDMDASPGEGVRGRLGFDRAELELHLAEAAYGMRDLTAARAHAEASLGQTTPGRPSWAAATLALAQGEAAQGRTGNAASLGLHVLDTMPPEMLRSTHWRRLRTVEAHLTEAGTREESAADLSDRLRGHRHHAGAASDGARCA